MINFNIPFIFFLFSSKRWEVMCRFIFLFFRFKNVIFNVYFILNICYLIYWVSRICTVALNEKKRKALKKTEKRRRLSFLLLYTITCMPAHSSFILVRFRPSVRVSPSFVFAMRKRNKTTKTKLGHVYTCLHQAYVCERERKHKDTKRKETEKMIALV